MLFYCFVSINSSYPAAYNEYIINVLYVAITKNNDLLL